MQRWTYSINEVSAGCYEIEAIRNTHNSISRKGFEDAIGKVLRDSFEMEMGFGTNPGEAVFHVTSGFKSSWNSKYDELVFGSWQVWNPKTKSCIAFDGKDSYIDMRYDLSKENPVYWAGRLPQIMKPDTDYFQKVIYFY